MVGLFALLLASANAFAPQSAVLRASTRSASVSMTTEGAQTSRRAMLASALLLVPAAANAMVVPGLNAPGLVKAKPQTGPRPEFAAIRDKTNFWSSKGIMDSVPKMTGIITPKSVYYEEGKTLRKD